MPILLAHELNGVRLQKDLNSRRVSVHQIVQLRQGHGHLKFKFPGSQAALKLRWVAYESALDCQIGTVPSSGKMAVACIPMSDGLVAVCSQLPELFGLRQQSGNVPNQP
jgi:hypothetical protein